MHGFRCFIDISGDNAKLIQLYLHDFDVKIAEIIPFNRAITSKNLLYFSS